MGETMLKSAVLVALVAQTLAQSSSGTSGRSPCSCCYALSSSVHSHVCNDEKEKSGCVWWSRYCGWNNTCGDTDFTCDSGILNCEPFLTDSGLFLFLSFFICMVNGYCVNNAFPEETLEKSPEFDDCPTSDFDCEKHDEEDKPVVRFIVALMKPVGAIAALAFQIQAVMEVSQAQKTLEDARIAGNLGTFDNCCSRVTGLEETSHFCYAFTCGAIITYGCYFFVTRLELVDPFRNQPYGGHGKVVAIIVKQWPTVIALIIALVGGANSKTASFDWGQGNCPVGGVVEKA